MKDGRPGRATAQLRTLERWRTVELEDAQTHYAVMTRIADQKQQDVERITDSIGGMHSYCRDQLHGAAALCVETLRRVADFAAQQALHLKAAESALEASQANAAEAREAMTKRFEELAVVEKLRERRESEMAKELLQLQQKQLDEYALNRAGNDGDSRQRDGQED